MFVLYMLILLFVASSSLKFPAFRSSRSAVSPSSAASSVHTPQESLEKAHDTYIWKYDYEIKYVRYGSDDLPPLLLIPGFGVGTFHYDRNIPELSKNFQVFSLDLLGQGMSWPLSRPTAEQRLCYSIDNWREQVQFFVENIIQKPVHIAGNSLGGYLAVCLASTNPELVKSLILLNAAPFWAFLPSTGAFRSSCGSLAEAMSNPLLLPLLLQNNNIR